MTSSNRSSDNTCRIETTPGGMVGSAVVFSAYIVLFMAFAFAWSGLSGPNPEGGTVAAAVALWGLGVIMALCCTASSRRSTSILGAIALVLASSPMWLPAVLT